MSANSIEDLHGLYLEDISIGMAASYAKTITETDIVLFAGISGDVNPVHLNQEFAAEIDQQRQRIYLDCQCRVRETVVVSGEATRSEPQLATGADGEETSRTMASNAQADLSAVTKPLHLENGRLVA